MLKERTPGEKTAYLDGFAAGAEQTAALSRTYAGRADLVERVQEDAAYLVKVVRLSLQAA